MHNLIPWYPSNSFVFEKSYLITNFIGSFSSNFLAPSESAETVRGPNRSRARSTTWTSWRREEKHIQWGAGKLTQEFYRSNIEAEISIYKYWTPSSERFWSCLLHFTQRLQNPFCSGPKIFNSICKKLWNLKFRT